MNTFGGMAWYRALMATVALAAVLGGWMESAQAQTNMAAKVKYAPSVNGRIEGSAWQFQGEGLNFNSGATITGSLFVPGTPGLNVNGSPTFGGTITNTGSSSPTGYWISLNSGSTLGNLVIRTDAGTLTSVGTPPSSSGTRSVNINSSSDSAGDFSTLKNLTLNGGGVFHVPAGTYDTFTANSGTGFRLGVTNGTTAAVYNFQSLNLNGSADIQVVGPVEIRVKNGFSANGAMGTSAHPEWLIIKISNGGFNFNSAYTMYGHVIAPNGTVMINSGCTIAGTVEADRLTVNSNGKLQWATAQGLGNQAPTANAQSVTTNEDTTATITLTGSDPEGSTLTYTVVSGPAHGTLSGTAPNLTYVPATNYFGTDAFTFKVNDGTVDSGTATVSITVTSVNDAPVLGAVTDRTITEGTALSITNTVTDVDSTGFTYSLGTNAPSGMTINTSTGVISWTPTEAQGPGTNVVSVTVTDNGTPALSSTRTFTVTVLEENSAPVLAALASQTVYVGQLLTVTNSATDSDFPANVLAYSLGTNAPPGMTVTNGVITWTPGAGYGNTTNVVSVTVADDGVPPLSDTKILVVTVLTTNHEPVLAGISNQVVVEGQLLTVTALASDVDGNALTYSLGTNVASGMAINATDGVITWMPTEAQGPSTNLVTVVVSDNGVPSLSDTMTFLVTVQESNAVPVFAVITNRTVVEGQLLTVTAVATDSDIPTNSLAYSLGTNAPTGMTINTVTGVISWTPTEEQGPGTNLVMVIVTDNGTPTLSATTTFTVTVLEENHAPVITVATNQVVVEGMLLVVTNSATDADVPANGLVYSFGTNAPAGMSINPTTGVITWTPTEAQGPGTNVVTVIVTDDGVPSLSATQTFTVVVLESNSAPVMIAPANQIAYEGTLLLVTNLVVDADVPANALTFSLGTNAPAGMSINPTSGVISWTPTEAQGPSTNVVEVLVSDDGVPSLGTNVFFTVTVIEVNNAPVLAGITNRVVLEGQTLTVTNAATDADVPVNSLSFDVAGAVPAGTVIDPVTGTITWTPTEAQGPSTNSITVRVTDDGVPALSHTRTFTVVVQEVNTAPVLVEVADQMVVEGQLLSLTAAATDADEPANTLTFSLGTNAPVGMSIQANTGVISWTPTETQGPSTNEVKVVVTDDGVPALSHTRTFTVVVLEANAAPVLASIPNQMVTEHELLALTVTATDADLPANSLLFSLGAGAPTGLLIDANSGVLTWTPTEAQGPSTNVVSVIVTDNGVPSLSATQTFTVLVLETNGAPMLAAPAGQTVFEEQLLVVMNSAADGDIPANLLTYALGAGAPAGLVIDPDSGAISWTPTEAQGPSTNVIEVIVTDNGVPPKSTNVFFTVNVLETNSAPMLAAITNHTVIEGQLLSVTNNVIDADVPANAFTFSLGTNAPAGMSINTTNGIISWTPTLTQGPSTNLVTVVAEDDGTPSLSATQTFTVFVLNSNSRPVAVPQLLTVNEEGTLTFTLTATDADNDPLTFTITEGPYSGTLSHVGTNYTFTPTTNFSGQTYLVFRAYDGQEESEPATNSITVLPVNDVPWVFSRTNTVMEGQSIHVGLLAYDVDGDAVSLILVSSPFLGTLSGTGTNLTYAASTNSFGLDRFEYQITDGVSTSEVAMVVFNVTPFARSKTWTSSADFSSGTLTNLSQQIANQLEPAMDEKAFNYVWAPIHSSGTVLRLDSETGRVLGEYRTTPQNVANGRPSRTWVDQQGNLWVANEEDNSVVMIATPESGRWVDRNNNGVLDTSIGQGNILAWTNAGGVNTNGGTSTAQDELIVFYTKLNGRTIRHLSMNRDGNIWAGGSSVNKFDLINQLTGQIIRTEQSIGRGGFGGFVNSKGILFSAGKFLRWDTAEPLSGVSPFSWNIQPDGSWNVAEDTDGNIWVTYEPSAFVRKFTPEGTEIGSFYHGGGWGQGMAIDPVTGDVWVAHSHCGDTVGRLKKDGTLVGTVKVASHGPTAVSIDRKGRIWVSSSTGLMQRINPLAGPIGADGVTPVGEVDLTTATLPGQSWAYSHFSGGAQVRGTQRGKWSAVFDSALTNAAWGTLSWNGLIYNQGNIVVRVSTSENGFVFGPSETVAFEGAAPSLRGRYLKVEADFVPAPSGEGPVLYDLTVGTAGYVYTPATQAWTISAGVDIEALWPDAVLLKGAIGRSPHTNSINPSVAWSLVSGPGTVTFDNANVIQPQVQFSTNGVYVFRITADNFGDVRTDEVTVDLTPYNRSPWVDAGINLFLRSTNEVLNLSGQVRDDGLPANTPLRVWWRQAYGPGTTLFNDVSNAVTQATFTTNGIYILELLADDGEYQPKRKIEVRVGALCTIEEPEGITAWWQANGDGADHINGNQLALPTISFFDQGKVGAAFKFDGSVAHTRAVNSPSLDIGKAAGFTIEFWAKPDDLRRVPLLTWHNGTQPGVLVDQFQPNSAFLDCYIFDTSNVSHKISLSGWSAGTWHHAALTYDKTTGVATVYLNGVLNNTMNLGIFEPQTSYDLYLGGNPGAGQARYKGLLDEVAIYRRALTGQEIYAIFEAGATGKCPKDGNRGPVVEAGPDRVLAGGGNTLILNGYVADDGLPVASTVEALWTKLSGPGNVVFAASNSPVTSVTFDAPGVYLLELSADDSSILLADVVEVRVETLAETVATNALAVLWPADGHNVDILAGNVAYLAGGANYQTGKVGQGFHFDGANDHAKVFAHPSHDIGDANAFTIELWVNAHAPNRGQQLLNWQTVNSQGASLSIRSNNELTVSLLDTNNVSHNMGVGGSFFPAGQFVHVAVTYDRISGRGRVYRNGVLVNTANLGGFRMKTTTDLYLAGDNNGGSAFDGVLDEISLYRRELAAEEIYQIFAAGTRGEARPGINLPPVVNAGPDLLLGSTNAPALLQGTAQDDTMPEGYLLKQWTKVAGPGNVYFAAGDQPVTAVTFDAPGLYILQLAANDGLVEGKDLVQVRVALECTTPATGDLKAWWTFNENNRDAIQGLEAAYYNGAGLTNGFVGAALNTANTLSHVRVEANPAIDIGQMAGYTTEIWVRQTTTPTDWSSPRPAVIWHANIGDSGGLSIYNGVRVLLTTIANINISIDVSAAELQAKTGTAMQPGVWRHVATTYDRAAGVFRIYVNGLLVKSSNVGNITLRTSGQMYLGMHPTQNLHFPGQLDEFAIHGRALDEGEVMNLYLSGAGGKCPADGNAAPVVFAGADFAFTDGLNTTTLAGQVTDDGLPAGINVTSVWRRVSGPGQVAFVNASSPSTTATFSTNGVYVLELSATDGQERSKDLVEVRVNVTCTVGELSGLVGWWPGNATTRDVLEGMDGIAANGASYTTGKVASAFSFDGANDYVRIPASAGVNIGTNQAFSIEFWFNPGNASYPSFEPRMVMGWRDGTMLYHYSSFTWHLMQTNGVNHSMTAGGPLVANTWQHVVLTYNSASGMARMYVNGAERFSQNRGSFTAKTTGDFYLGGHLDQARPYFGGLDEVSMYSRELSVSEIASLYNAGGVGKCPTPRNEPPFVFAGANRTHYLPGTAMLHGAVYDDGRPVGGTLDIAWTYLSGPAPVLFSATNTPVTTVEFTQPGVYEFELAVDDGEFLDYDTVTITVLADPRTAPVVALSSPLNPTVVEVAPGGVTSLTVTASASDADGTVTQVELFQGSTSLGVFTNAPYSVALTDVGVGTYVLTAVATDDDGLVTTSTVANAYVYVDNGPPVVEIITPVDATEVTAPTTVTGTASSAILVYYVLEYRALSADNANAWVTLSSNTVSVVNGALGALDPTLALNGIYELRVRAMDVRNRSAVTEPVSVIFDRNMKIGNFAFSFNDLTIPVAGIPITITRSYDSRNKEMGDFGVGWTMDINNIRLQKNRHLGINWEQTVEPGLFPVYGIRTSKSRVVTITFPDGNVYKFGAVPSPAGQFGLPLIYPKIKFLPFEGVQGTLTPLVEIDGQLYPDDQVVYAGDNPGFGPLLSFELLLNPPPGAADNIYFNPDLFEFKTKEGYSYVISETNGLRSITDLNNNTLTFTTNGMLHSTGKSVVFERNAAGLITNIVDAAGHAMQYQYDTNGNLVTFIDRAGETNSFTYDGKHNLITVRDKKGIQTSSNGYDDEGRLISQMDAYGFTIGHNHDLVNRRDYTTNRLGYVIMKEYDERGNIVKIVDPVGATTLSTYDLNDNLLVKIDALGRRTTYAYDQLDNQIAVTNEACGCIPTLFTYNAYGMVLTMKDSSGTITNTYDSRGNMLSSSDPAGRITTFAYDSKGKVTSRIDPKGGVTTFRYDQYGSLTNEVNALGHEIDYEVDANGKMLSMTTYRTVPQSLQLLSFGQKNKTLVAPKGAKFSLAANEFSQRVHVRLYYDEAGRPITTIYPDESIEVIDSGKNIVNSRLIENENPDGSKVSYTYDPEGRVACTTDELGRTTCFDYDPRGLLTRTTYPNGCTSQAFYDFVGQLIMEIDRFGATNTYTYDGDGNRITSTDTYGSTTTYTYNERKAVTSKTDSLGRTTAYEFDFLNRNTNVVYPDGSTKSYTYDGRLVLSETDQDGKTTYNGYDILGRLTSVTNALGEVRRFEYDEASNPITEIAPNGDIVRHAYDLLNRRTNTTFPDGTFRSAAYDSTGKKVSETDTAGATTFYSYDSRGRVVKNIDKKGGTNLFEFSFSSQLMAITNAQNEVVRYEYDNDGNKVRTRLPDGTKEENVFGNCGRLLTTIDRAGKETHFAYDLLGRVVSITDPTGSVKTFTYDSEGQILTEVDGNGEVTGYAYDSLGRETHVFHPDGTVSTTTYDRIGRVFAQTDAGGNTTTFGYDAAGRLLNQTNAQNQVTRYAYDVNGRLISQTDAFNITTSFSYDSLGRRTNVVLANGGSESWTYNQRGQIATQTDANGNVTWFTYDTAGRLIAVTNALNQVLSYAYDVLGRMVAITDAANRTTTFGYDVLGRRTNVTFPDGATYSTAYDERGLATVQTDALGNTTKYGYDDAGRMVATTNALNEITRYAYDAVGRLVASVDANNRTNYFSYDPMGRPISVVMPDLSQANTYYDALGRRIAVMDQAGRSTWFGYDSLGRMTAVTNSLGNVTRYEYDALGRMTSQIDAANRVTRYEYDVMGQRTKRILPDNKEEIYRYDLNGNLTNRTDFNGRTTTYTYDSLNRMTSKIPDAVFGQAPVQYAYTVTGTRQSMTDILGTTTYGYDLRDRLLQKAAPHGTLNYTYDLNGNLRTMQSAQVNGVGLEYEYDPLNRMNAVVDQHTGRTTYTFDPVGNLQGFTYPNGINHYHQYDALDRLTNLTASTVLTNVSSYRYTLLPSGHRQSVQELSGRTVTYGYDATYRLTNETVNVPGWPSAGVVDYDYDAVGNRLNRASNIPELPLQAFTYDANDRLQGETYDDNGNTLTSTNVWSSFSTSVPVNDKYDYEDMLVDRGNGQVTIVYDGDGNRVKKTVNGVSTWYVVDEQNPTGYAQVVEELVVNSTNTAQLDVVRVYAWGHQLVSMDQVVGNDWVPRFYGYDGKGSVRQLYNEYGYVTDTYDYDAFGNLIHHTGSTFNNYQYTGEQFDADLGLYYLRARYHNPNSGRMWTMDSFEGFDTDPQSLHKYTFNHNDPVNRRDPSGHYSMVEMSLVSGLAPLVRMTLDHISAGVYNFSHGGAGGSELKAKSHEEALYIDSLGAGAGGLAMGRSNFYNTQRGAPFLLSFNIPWSNYPQRTGCAFELLTGDNGEFAIYGCPSQDPLFENTYDPELLAMVDSVVDTVSGLSDVDGFFKGIGRAAVDAAKGLAPAVGTVIKGSAGWFTALWDEELAYETYGNEMAAVVDGAVALGTVSGAAFDTLMYGLVMGANPGMAEAKYGHGVDVMKALGKEVIDTGTGGDPNRNVSTAERLGYVGGAWLSGKAVAKAVSAAVKVGSRAKAAVASVALAAANQAWKLGRRAKAAMMATIGPKLNQCVTTVKKAVSSGVGFALRIRLAPPDLTRTNMGFPIKFTLKPSLADEIIQEANQVAAPNGAITSAQANALKQNLPRVQRRSKAQNEVLRAEWERNQNAVMAEWELQTNREWPPGATPHHIIPLESGGANKWYNIVPTYGELPNHSLPGIAGPHAAGGKLRQTIQRGRRALPPGTVTDISKPR